MTSFFVFGLSALIYAGNEENKQQAIEQQHQLINQAVKAELSSFLELIPSGMEKQHGFNSRAEFAKAIPSSIYRVVEINSTGTISETNFFNVVVAVNNDFRAVLMVSLIDGKYEIETVGGAPLALELQEYENEHILVQGQERLMVNVLSKAASFVSNHTINESIENATLLPLESGKTALGTGVAKNSQKGYSFQELINALELQ